MVAFIISCAVSQQLHWITSLCWKFDLKQVGNLKMESQLFTAEFKTCFVSRWPCGPCFVIAITDYGNMVAMERLLLNLYSFRWIVWYHITSRRYYRIVIILQHASFEILTLHMITISVICHQSHGSLLREAYGLVSCQHRRKSHHQGKTLGPL